MASINEILLEIMSGGIMGIDIESHDIRIVIIFALLQIIMRLITWAKDKKNADANTDKLYSESDNIDAITIATLMESIGKLQTKTDEQYEANNALRIRISDVEDENRLLMEKISYIETENKRLSSVNESNQQKIEALETENKDLRQILTDTGLNNKRITDRLTNGVRRLSKQIESMGHTPAFRLENE